MKVKEIMKTGIISLDPNLSCKEAARVFLENKISGAPVINARGELVGIISEKDIFRGLFPCYRDFYEAPDAYLDFEELEADAAAAAKESVSKVMITRLITASPETPILKVAAQMLSSGIHRLPVVDGGKLAGIVTRRDIYRAIMRKYLGLKEVKENKKRPARSKTVKSK